MHTRWVDEIADHLEKRFGYVVTEAAPIDKGWLNVKWRMETDRGPLFVKFYHPDRYKFHLKPERRSAIEKTLRLQRGLSDAGIPCPKTYDCKGQFIQETLSGFIYAVSDWAEGQNVPAGHLNADQMFELGQAAGRMHQWLRSVPPLDRPAWEPNVEEYMKEWEANWTRAEAAGDSIVLEWLSRSRSIVQSLDTRTFASGRIGWLHWDLWVDNILVHPRSIAAIVDFDRMSMAYQDIDVARALLSEALRDGQLQSEPARAFMQGYRVYAEAPRGLVARALRMLYMIESLWWLTTEIRTQSKLRGLLSRFIYELHWIEDYWNALPEMTDDW
jgi:homoserine kinase type II